MQMGFFTPKAKHYFQYKIVALYLFGAKPILRLMVELELRLLSGLAGFPI